MRGHFLAIENASPHSAAAFLGRFAPATTCRSIRLRFCSFFFYSTERVLHFVRFWVFYRPAATGPRRNSVVSFLFVVAVVVSLSPPFSNFLKTDFSGWFSPSNGFFPFFKKFQRVLSTSSAIQRPSSWPCKYHENIAFFLIFFYIALYPISLFDEKKAEQAEEKEEEEEEEKEAVGTTSFLRFFFCNDADAAATR